MVMNEPCLRGKKERCLMGPQKQGIYDITVKQLILSNEKQWGMRLIRDLFDLAAIEDILQVPLLKDVEVDRLIWKEEQNGVYSVRSGYNLWRKSLVRNDDDNRKEDWNSLWNLKAPTRTKHLLWKICKGCLPTRIKLRQHFVPCP